MELLGKLSGQITNAAVNFNNFNFANLTEAHISAMLDAVAQRDDESQARVRRLVINKLPLPPEEDQEITELVQSALAHRQCSACGFTGYFDPVDSWKAGCGAVEDAASAPPAAPAAPLALPSGKNGSNGHT